MRYHVLACDYDGTIARDGLVDNATLDALERLSVSGRKLVLVTGRELQDLLRVFPRPELFHRIVAENGAVVHEPARHRTRTLGPPPPPEFVAELARRGVKPLSAGRVIVATWEPHERVVVDVIRELGLEMQVIFNKGAVMVLPSGLNKRTGLVAALDDLELSRHNCVGVGDAENDHAFLDACACSCAVANAVPGLKARADVVLRRDHGQGVAELIETLLDDDLSAVDPARHHVPLGTTEAEQVVALRPDRCVVLVAGSSGGGKSTAALAIAERLMEREYQLCIVDPEGDYDGLEGLAVTGGPDHAPDLDHLAQTLARPAQHVAVNLVGVALADRPRVFEDVLARLRVLRASAGRPHWILVDEAHHVLHAAFGPRTLGLLDDPASLILVTVNPAKLHPLLLERADVLIAVGTQDGETIEGFARASGKEPPTLPSPAGRQDRALVWLVGSGTADRIAIATSRGETRRHRRKYAQGDLGPDKSFYFRGPHGTLNLRAQNLLTFSQMAEGVDDETWLFHLHNGDFDAWLSGTVKDHDLARVVRDLAGSEVSPAEGRARLRDAIEERYTLG